MPLLRRILIVSSGVGALRVGGMGLMFLAQLLLARLLGVTGYGQFAFALAWVQVLAIPASMGMQTAGPRFVAEYVAVRAYSALNAFLRFQAVAALTGGVVLALLMALAVELAGGQLAEQGRRVLFAGALCLPFAALALALQGALRGLHRQSAAEAADRLSRPLGLILVPAAAIWFYGTAMPSWAMYGYLLGLVAAVAFQVVLLVRAVRSRTADGQSPSRENKRWLLAGVTMMLLASMQILMNRLDILMLGAIRGPEDAGVYAAASRLSELASIALAVSNTVVAPIVSEFHSTGRRRELQRTLTTLARLASLVSLCAVAGVWLLGEWALGLFGDEFRIGFAPLLILVFGQLVNGICGPVGYVATMTGHERLVALVQLAALCLNVVLNVVLIPRFGMTGAAAATAMALSFWNIVLLFAVRRRVGLDPSVLGTRGGVVPGPGH